MEEEQLQHRLPLELMVAVGRLIEMGLPMVAQELRLEEVEVLVEPDSVVSALLVPPLLLLRLRQEVLRAAVADELAPAAAVLLLVRHPSGHTQPSGSFYRPTVETAFNSPKLDPLKRHLTRYSNQFLFRSQH